MTDRFWPKLDLSYQKGWTFPDIKYDNKWLILYGETGSGKTEYAKSLLAKWEGWEFTNVVAFFSELKKVSKNEGSIGDFLRTVKEYPQMILDDLGFEPDEKFMVYGTEYRPIETMKEVLTERHARRLTTIITTNLNPQNLKKKYGDRIYSRTKELATWYLWKGDRRKGDKATAEKKS